MHIRFARAIIASVGGTTPAQGNAAGSMDTWQTYDKVLADQQRQQQIGQAITKGTSQFAKDSQTSTPQVNVGVPQVPTMQMPQAQSTAQGITIQDALNRILGGI